MLELAWAPPPPARRLADVTHGCEARTVDPAPASVLKVLDVYLFDSLEQVREITEAWLETYSTERPHDSLGQVPPLTFLPKPDAPAKSPVEVSM